MTNELKEKILECLIIFPELNGNYYLNYYLLDDERLRKLLAIIDEGIEEAKSFTTPFNSDLN